MYVLEEIVNRLKIEIEMISYNLKSVKLAAKLKLMLIAACLLRKIRALE
jgi:hypothetical protein